MGYTDTKAKLAAIKAAKRNPPIEGPDVELPKKKSHKKKPYAIEQRMIRKDGKDVSNLLRYTRLGNWWRSGRYTSERNMKKAFYGLTHQGSWGWNGLWTYEYRMIYPDGTVVKDI